MKALVQGGEKLRNRANQNNAYGKKVYEQIIYNSSWAWDKTKTFWGKACKKSTQQKNRVST